MQRQASLGSPSQPHGQGFIAATSWKFAEKVSEPFARLTVTTLSSIGWRITSRTRLPNSGNSSKNKTPLTIKLTVVQTCCRLITLKMSNQITLSTL